MMKKLLCLLLVCLTPLAALAESGIPQVNEAADDMVLISDDELLDRMAQVAPEGEADNTGFAVLPDDLATIEAGAFEGDAAITVVDAHSCTSIGANAFRNCAGLTQILVHKECQIDGTAFAGCGTVVVFAPAGGSTEQACSAIENCEFIAEIQTEQ